MENDCQLFGRSRKKEIQLEAKFKEMLKIKMVSLGVNKDWNQGVLIPRVLLLFPLRHVAFGNGIFFLPEVKFSFSLKINSDLHSLSHSKSG